METKKKLLIHDNGDGTFGFTPLSSGILSIPNWLNLSSLSGPDGASATIEASQENESRNSRRDSIIFTASTAQQTANVTQEGKDIFSRIALQDVVIAPSTGGIASGNISLRNNLSKFYIQNTSGQIIRSGALTITWDGGSITNNTDIPINELYVVNQETPTPQEYAFSLGFTINTTGVLREMNIKLWRNDQMSGSAMIVVFKQDKDLQFKSIPVDLPTSAPATGGYGYGNYDIITNQSFRIKNNSSSPRTIAYSIDGGTNWTEQSIASGTSVPSITFAYNKLTTVRFRSLFIANETRTTPSTTIKVWAGSEASEPSSGVITITTSQLAAHIFSNTSVSPTMAPSGGGYATANYTIRSNRQYLTIKNLTGNVTGIEYSTDGIKWNTLSFIVGGTKKITQDATNPLTYRFRMNITTGNPNNTVRTFGFQAWAGESTTPPDVGNVNLLFTQAANAFKVEDYNLSSIAPSNGGDSIGTKLVTANRSFRIYNPNAIDLATLKISEDGLTWTDTPIAKETSLLIETNTSITKRFKYTFGTANTIAGIKYVDLYIWDGDNTTIPSSKSICQFRQEAALPTLSIDKDAVDLPATEAASEQIRVTTNVPQGWTLRKNS